MLKGKVEVEPIFLSSSADAAESTNMWRTFYNDYEQKKRWAWGVSDLPLFIKMYVADAKTSFVNKSIRLFRVIEDHLLWPVNWFVITAGVAIVNFVNPAFGRTSLGFALPKISSYILSVTVVFMIILIAVELKQRPPQTPRSTQMENLDCSFEFLLMPIVGFFFGALPGLDAHTRLMLGKYLEYRVTEKV